MKYFYSILDALQELFMNCLLAEDRKLKYFNEVMSDFFCLNICNFAVKMFYFLSFLNIY